MPGAVRYAQIWTDFGTVLRAERQILSSLPFFRVFDGAYWFRHLHCRISVDFLFLFSSISLDSDLVDCSHRITLLLRPGSHPSV
jgi:hypothetical protein